MVNRLRIADPSFRVFGSGEHRYQLGARLSESELTTFESANRIRLPEDYRRFLTAIGNGGAGPFYGLEPLGTFWRDLSQPFPFVMPTNLQSNDKPKKQLDPSKFGGVLEFCHQGCAIYSYLVVNGPTYGTIWSGREEFYPTGLTFSAWYRRWAERALRVLDNEPLVQRLQVGMSVSEVIAEVGGDWKARQILHGPLRLFESPDIPAQLELDEQDIVVKVRPWPFL